MDANLFHFCDQLVNALQLLPIFCCLLLFLLLLIFQFHVLEQLPHFYFAENVVQLLLAHVLRDHFLIFVDIHILSEVRVGFHVVQEVLIVFFLTGLFLLFSAFLFLAFFVHHDSLILKLFEFKPSFLLAPVVKSSY